MSTVRTRLAVGIPIAVLAAPPIASGSGILVLRRRGPRLAWARFPGVVEAPHRRIGA